ncbi:hypothetical protein [Mesorhizobium sp.]|uniref:hypothetical protein n=1 Tax=Mesorhizobium sp. TaxID=1871066 RepID=UPI0025E44B23|nr:hypothetical protein [Mesorhizobium sp.]
MSNAIIPLPTRKPDLGAVAQIPQIDTKAEIFNAEAPGVDAPSAEAPDAEANGAAQHQSIEKLAGSRPVRAIGPAFFPAD